MADVKDILGLGKGPAAASLSEKKKSYKELGQKKPDGISREVYALTGGIPPMMPMLDPAAHKKKRISGKKVQWAWNPFTSTARSDNLELHHWVKIVDGVGPSGDYPFAKFNKSVDVLRYTNDEYLQFCQDKDWSREETDHLFDMCQRFDLRFIVIADRYEEDGTGGWPARTVEELKERYYTVVRTLMIVRAGAPEDVADHPLVKDPYDARYETERKRALHLLFSQTAARVREEKEVLAEAARILEGRRVAGAGAGAEEEEEEEEERRHPHPHHHQHRQHHQQQQQHHHHPHHHHPTLAAARPGMGAGSAAAGERAGVGGRPIAAAATADAAGVRVAAPTGRAQPPVHYVPRVLARSKRLQQQVASATSAIGARQQKRVEAMLEELGIPAKAEMPTKAVCEQYLALRKELAHSFLLQKKVQAKQQEVMMLRENPSADIPSTPNTPKRMQRMGHMDEPRMVMMMMRGADGGGGGGPEGEHRQGKRSEKRKAPARFSDAPPSPPSQKRNRKLKVVDD